MIRKRFPRARRMRIIAWTAVAIAWATAIVARTLGVGAADATEAASPSIAPPAAVTSPSVGESSVPVPNLPEDGLVVLRYTPGPKPEPEVRRVVVTQQAPAVSVPATTKTSSGS